MHPFFRLAIPIEGTGGGSPSSHGSSLEKGKWNHKWNSRGHPHPPVAFAGLPRPPKDHIERWAGVLSNYLVKSGSTLPGPAASRR